MRNAPCTPLSPEEEAAILNAFPVDLTPEEDESAADLFQPYVFYETRPDRSRDCWCTSCRNRFHVSRRGHADFFRASHKGARSAMKSKAKAACPLCGADAVLIAANKFRTFLSLCEYRLVVRLTAWDGWLLAQAGVVVREFERNEYYDVTEERRFHEFRRFAFKPGRRNEWNLTWLLRTVSQCEWARAGAADFLPGGCYARSISSRWAAAKSVGEAHYPAPYRKAPYHIINPDALGQSDMRYCQFFEWFDAEYGVAVDKARYHLYFCPYLSEFTRRPQMEFLVKLGYEKIISDLLLNSFANRDLLNWKAKNPADFFRLNKADFRMFHDADCDLKDLRRFHTLKADGMVRDMREFASLRADFAERFAALCECCTKARVTLRRGAAYVTETAVQISPPHAGIRRGVSPTAFKPSMYVQDVIVTWDDYLRAAQRLNYDLTRDDVRMPRNLSERHDAATRTVSVEADKAKQKAYLRMYPQLKQRYEYCESGLEIVVPTCAQDIVWEGKMLRHCVGGYAARHMEGQVSILFLRKEEEPSMPYVTIEMTVDNNPRNLRMVQIHGYRNDRDTASPRETHKDFLDRWLEWVHEGSPRDDDGLPVTEETETERVRVETRL